MSVNTNNKRLTGKLLTNILFKSCRLNSPTTHKCQQNSTKLLFSKVKNIKYIQFLFSYIKTKFLTVKCSKLFTSLLPMD